MFERFTDRARKVMALANQEAQSFNHNYIGTEHILLGLLKEGYGVGANSLKNLGINLEKAREEVIKVLVPATEDVCMGKLPRTPNAAKALAQAIECAIELNHHYIGTEHILLALANSKDNVAATVLENLGATPDKIKAEVLNLLGTDEKTAAKVSPQTYMERTLILASKGHAGQKRSNGSAYINHPVSVNNRLIAYGIKDEFVLATALCHDLLEDTKITEKEIEEIAGVKVLEAVKQLTNIVPAGTKFEDKTAAMLAHAKHYGDIAKRVKLADRYDNLADAIWDWDPARVKRYAEAGIRLLDAMQPLPDDVKSFEKEALRFFACLV